MYHNLCDFNLNLLDYENCKKVQDFLNPVYQNGMIQNVNEPARVTRKTTTPIDHIFTNTFLDKTFKLEIRYFKDWCVIPFSKDFSNSISPVVKRRWNFEYIQKIAAFNVSPHQNNWIEILEYENVNEAYNNFLDTFSPCMTISFQLRK